MEKQPELSDIVTSQTCGVVPEPIPNILKQYTQWVCWHYMDTGRDKPEKQPLNPKTLGHAGVGWANTWSSFEKAYSVYCSNPTKQIDGIGFVLTKNDPLVAIDIDKCVSQGGIAPEAISVIDKLCSYTEISPSGKGLRILVLCPKFQENARQRSIEIYSHDRWVSITGHHLAHTPNEIVQVSVDTLRSLLPERTVPTPTATQALQIPATDEQLWARIFTHDKFGAQHQRRFQGDTSLDGGDHSMTVIRLLNCLARWSRGDTVRMRRMILQSPLANAKWLEKRGAQDWLDYQIVDAIAYVQGHKRR